MLGIELQPECQPLYLSTLCLPLMELNEYNIKVKQAAARNAIVVGRKLVQKNDG